eukprot:5596832-Pyramimonas_sp.AAC.1
MVRVAAGGTWPRQRIMDEVGGIDSATCPRCGEGAETPLHRSWLCSCNVGSRAYDQSDNLTAEAVAQHESHACFWLRGIIPGSWTNVPPPPSEPSWIFSGSNELGPHTLGLGSQESPNFLFGDSSGGEDSRDPRLRR